MNAKSLTKPLQGIRVLDFSALGPGPFAARLLADYGAEVVTVESPAVDFSDAGRMFGRGKKSIILDLKADGAAEFVLGIADQFDVLIESMRPGKMEALGLGPEIVKERAPRLIYARLTGFGQSGPLAAKAAHDINALAISGCLSLCGISQPLPPAALLGDFAGGSMMVVVGTLLALLERERTGEGTVVDAAMVDGATLLIGAMLPMLNKGMWGNQGSNLLDGSRPFYTTYQCADGKWMAVGAIEAKFWYELIRALELQDEIDPAHQHDESSFVKTRELLSKKFLSRSRDDWTQAFEFVDACVTPVLQMDELVNHPHHIARHTVYASGGGVHAGLAPKLSTVDECLVERVPEKGADGYEVLLGCGLSSEEISWAIERAIVVTP